MSRLQGGTADGALRAQAKPYKVMAKALSQKGDFEGAYVKVCTGIKVDYDEDAAALQKALKVKVDKIKKNAEIRAKAAAA